jgi:hypothetical protein
MSDQDAIGAEPIEPPGEGSEPVAELHKSEQTGRESQVLDRHYAWADEVHALQRRPPHRNTQRDEDSDVLLVIRTRWTIPGSWK